MARIWIDDHGSGMGKPGKRVASTEAFEETVAAWQAFNARGYVYVDSTAGHVVLRCPNHVDGACAQINVQKG